MSNAAIIMMTIGWGLILLTTAFCLWRLEYRGK
jgi:hypothetical protein